VSVSVINEASAASAPSKTDNNVGAIVGGIFAASVVLAVVAVLIRRRNQTQVKGWDWEAAEASSSVDQVGESEI